MKQSWTAGLNKEDARKLREDFASSAYLRKRLSEILAKKMEAEDKGMLSKTSYDAPNWSLLQADAVGYKRAMQEVINLVFPLK